MNAWMSAAVCLSVFASALVSAGEPEKKIKDDLSKGTHGADVSEETMKAVAEQMMADMAPGPQHAHVAALAGEWTARTSYTMSPDAPPMTGEYQVTNVMILGGRFLETRSKGDFMGQPFENLMIFGYDRRHEEFTIVGFDTMGTYSVAGQGGRDEKTGVIKMKGTTHDPKLGATERYSFVIRDVSADSYTIQIWFTKPDGGEMMVVESVARRRK